MNKPAYILTLFIAVAVLAGFMGWLAGVFNEKIPPGQQQPLTAPIEARPYSVRTVTEPTLETATGTISARDKTVVSSRILATIRAIPVRAGDSVNKGDVLVELDDRELESQVEQARQSVLGAKARLNEATAEFERIKSIYEKRLISRSEYDQAQATLESRQAEYQGSLRQLEETRTARTYTTINSPIDGRVIERFAEPGDTASPGKPLLEIYNPSILRLDARVRESLAASIHIGDELQARIDAINKEIPATVDEIVPSADPGSRSITVKALLSSDAALYPGMFGRLLIPTGSSERLYIPQIAIRRMGQLEYVEVLEDDRAVRRFIRTGRSNDQGQVDVLAGLQTGETILLPGR